MSAAVVTKNWLVELGAGEDQNAEAIIAQGLKNISNLTHIEPDDINVICNPARKPGGTISNGARQPVPIPNPGRSIPALLQQRLKKAVMDAHHYDAVGRTIEPSI